MTFTEEFVKSFFKPGQLIIDTVHTLEPPDETGAVQMTTLYISRGKDNNGDYVEFEGIPTMLVYIQNKSVPFLSFLDANGSNDMDDNFIATVVEHAQGNERSDVWIRETPACPCTTGDGTAQWPVLKQHKMFLDVRKNIQNLFDPYVLSRNDISNQYGGEPSNGDNVRYQLLVHVGGHGMASSSKMSFSGIPTMNLLLLDNFDAGEFDKLMKSNADFVKVWEQMYILYREASPDKSKFSENYSRESTYPERLLSLRNLLEEDSVPFLYYRHRSSLEDGEVNALEYFAIKPRTQALSGPSVWTRMVGTGWNPSWYSDPARQSFVQRFAEFWIAHKDDDQTPDSFDSFWDADENKPFQCYPDKEYSKHIVDGFTLFYKENSSSNNPNPPINTMVRSYLGYLDAQERSNIVYSNVDGEQEWFRLPQKKKKRIYNPFGNHESDAEEEDVPNLETLEILALYWLEHKDRVFPYNFRGFCNANADIFGDIFGCDDIHHRAMYERHLYDFSVHYHDFYRKGTPKGLPSLHYIIANYCSILQKRSRRVLPP